MGIKFSLIVVGALIAVVFLGVKVLGLYTLFGVIIPYLAIFTFIGGFVLRIFDWARSPFPSVFRPRRGNSILPYHGSNRTSWITPPPQPG